jgi:hypothetical protein
VFACLLRLSKSKFHADGVLTIVQTAFEK